MDMKKCPKCGKALTQKFSRRGRFFGCTGYPECNYIKRPGQAEGEEREKPKITEFPCPTCGKFLVERTGKNGPFFGCSGYPECKTVMNVGDDGKPQHMPWEDWRAGEDLNTSGWMRATAPAGDATFEGVVSWSGELGYGVRSPEPTQDVRDEKLEGNH
mgnify:CR=1 FL=1